MVGHERRRYGMPPVSLPAGFGTLLCSTERLPDPNRQTGRSICGAQWSERTHPAVLPQRDVLSDPTNMRVRLNFSIGTSVPSPGRSARRVSTFGGLGSPSLA